jgi:hypothetical protein
LTYQFGVLVLFLKLLKLGENEMKDHHCKTCQGNLNPGEKCPDCGRSCMSLAESAATLYRAQQPPFDQFANKFEGDIQQLTAMIDIRFRVNYPSWNQTRTDEMVNRIRNGELPSNLVLET